MKSSALALDYDGTIATAGVFDPAVRQAVGEVRQRGIVVILVTGRRLLDLHAVGGDLTCFDAIVAENGAVVEFPASGRHGDWPSSESGIPGRVAAPGIPFVAGKCVLEADVQWAQPMLEVIRSLTRHDRHSPVGCRRSS